MNVSEIHENVKKNKYSVHILHNRNKTLTALANQDQGRSMQTLPAIHPPTDASRLVELFHQES